MCERIWTLPFFSALDALASLDGATRSSVLAESDGSAGLGDRETGPLERTLRPFLKVKRRGLLTTSRRYVGPVFLSCHEI